MILAVLAAVFLLLAIWFVIAGNRRYLGHRPTEWMTPGQRIVVWGVVGFAVAVLVWRR